MKTIKSCVTILLASMAIGALGCPDPDRSPSATTTAETRSATTATPSAAAADDDASTVVATIHGESITLGEVDEQIEVELNQIQMECKKGIHDLRRSGVDALIAQRLFAEEAQRLGLESEEAFIVQAVERGTPYPTEEEAEAFFNENRHMMGDQSFESVKPRVIQFLHQKKQRERFESILTDLRQKAGVTVTLVEPRVEVEATGPSKGPADAPITIVEFSNFLCPFCERGSEVMNELREEYGDKVRLVFRHYPSIEDENSTRAAEAAACAGLQDRFWQMHDALFAARGQVSPDALSSLARDIEGIDGEKFDSCMRDGGGREKVLADMSAGRAAGVSGTPAYFVNGVSVLGAQPIETFKEIIEQELGEDEAE